MEWIKLTEDAVIPTRATLHSAGYDFTANETVRLLPNHVAIIKTGIALPPELPKNLYMEITLRSGFVANRPFVMPNGYGLIDADYEGDIGIIVWNRGTIPATIDKGDKIAQGVFQQYYTMKNEIKPTKKRTGGYGSTNE